MVNRTEIDHLDKIIDERIKEATTLANKRGSDMILEVETKFSSFNRLLTHMQSDFDTAIANFKKMAADKRVGELKESLPALNAMVDEIYALRPSVSFVFEFDVTELLDPKNFGKKWRSETFFCRGWLANQ